MILAILDAIRHSSCILVVWIILTPHSHWGKRILTYLVARLVKGDFRLLQFEGKFFILSLNRKAWLRSRALNIGNVK